MKKVILILLMCLLNGSLFAAEGRLIGFSSDGKYCLYVDEGFSEGDVFYEAALRVVDVAANDFVGKKVYSAISLNEALARTVEGASTEYDMAAIVLYGKMSSRIKAMKNEYGIQSELWDKRIFVHLLDLPAQPNMGMSSLDAVLKTRIHSKQFNITKEDGAMRTYTLTLDERDAPNAPGNKIFTLSVSRNGKTKILQKDKKLYTSRKGPIAYSISDIYYFQGKLAVIIESVIPSPSGIEGRYIVRPLIVTGDFKMNK